MNAVAPSIAGLTPLLEIFDMERSLRFYRDILGFTVESIAEGRGWCMLVHGGNTRLMLNTQYDEDEQPKSPPLDRTRWHSDTTLYFDADPQVIFNRLRELEWPASEPVLTSYNFWQTSTHDPDGFGLAFLRPA